MAPVSKWFKGLFGSFYEKWHEIGRQEGLEWAKSRARANELRYAATVFKTQKERGKIISYDPSKNKAIGPAFVGVFEKYHFTWEETEPFTYVPEGRYQEWEQGFAEAVREYWEKIKK